MQYFQFAQLSMQIVFNASQMDISIMSNYYRTNPNGQNILANYILDGTLPDQSSKWWVPENIKQLKEIGDYLFDNRVKILNNINQENAVFDLKKDD